MGWNTELLRTPMTLTCRFYLLIIRQVGYTNQYKQCHYLYPYLPGMVKAGIDFDQVVALAAPRKFFLGWAARDEGTPEVMYRAFMNAIERRCAEEGLPPSVYVHEEKDGGHEITEPMVANAMRFLQENVG